MKVRWLALLLVLLLAIPFTAAANPTHPIASSQTGDGDEPADPPVPLVRGAPLHGANGITFDQQGRLYIASLWGREIAVMDPDSGRFLQHLGTAQGVEGPDDLVFGPDGSLYFTVILDGTVRKIGPDGTVSVVAQLPPGANPIAFSDDGRLFVALAFLGDALYEVDPKGVAAPRLIGSNWGWLNAFDWGADGYLYAPVMHKGQVIKIDVDTGESTVVAEGLEVPTSAKFDAAGNLFVLDQAAGEVVELDLKAGTRRVVSEMLPGMDNMAFDAKGRLFVSHAEDGSIMRVLPNGKYVYVSPRGVIIPGGVAVLPAADGREKLFVADLWTLRRFDAQTGRTRPLGEDYTRAFQAFTVAPFGDKLVLTSIIEGAVHVVDPATLEVLWSDHSFGAPLNAIGFQGDIVVSDLGTSQVIRRLPNGDHVTLAQLAVPSGLAASADSLWAADWAMGAVFQIVAGGAVLNPPVPVAGDLAFPEGLAADAKGGLYVVETGKGQLSYIDLKTGAVSEVLSGLNLSVAGPPMPMMLPTRYFNGVAVAPSGAVFVTSDLGSQVLRIDPE